MKEEQTKAAVQMLVHATAQLVLAGGDAATAVILEQIARRVREGENSRGLNKGAGNA